MKQHYTIKNPAKAMQTSARILKRFLGTTLRCVGAGLLASAALALPGHAAATPLKQLRGHVVPAAAAKLKPNGELAAATELQLAIGLPLRNTVALTNLLEQLYNPASTNYHHFLTPEQFTERFGPTEQDYAMVKNFARVNGLTVVGSHRNRLVLDVRGKAANIEKALHIKLQTYKHPTENRNFFMPSSDPEVADGLPIIYVSGLQDYSLPRPKLKPMPVGGNLPKPRVGNIPVANVGSGPGGSYQGQDFRTAYVPGTKLTGAGQSVGLLQFDGFFESDIIEYANQIGLTNMPNLVVIPIDGGVSTPTFNGSGEVSLDIEMILSMSPGVSNIYVYEAPNPSPWVDILSRMADDNLARQLSCSWGGGPPDPTAEQIFQQMAVQGQSFFNASGDSDAFIGFIPFPSDSPNITQVGGTTLTTGTGSAYSSETVWNWGNEFGPAFDGEGSSGGISSYYSIPSWQTNIDMPGRKGSSTMRNVPDVAMTGDNVWVIFFGGQTGAFGGTSCAAPLWAGFMALVNQQASQTGVPSVGFINPAIYRLAAENSVYTNCFHDTITGDNTWSASPDQFYATNNYDLCTGLGSPNGTNLINALAAPGSTNPIVHITPPPPPYGSTLANLNGSNPNGTWQLFVQDDAAFNSGIISNGWYLSLTTANPVGFSADLDLAMAASTTNLSVSNYLTYTLTVTNYGPSVSSNVVVSDTMPLGAAFISSTAGQGSVMRSGQVLNWTVGELNPYSGSKLVFTVEPTGVGNINNYATATADTPDDNPANDFASITANVQVPTPPQLTGAYVAADGSFQFSVAGTPGVTNVIQASTNLVNWVNIYTNISPFTYTNMDTGSYPQEFYRAIAP